MKPLHSILLLIPWLASCDPISVHVFEPLVSGAPVRTPEAQARLRKAVVDTAVRHNFTEYKRPKESGLAKNGGVIEESLLDYDKHGRLGMKLYRDHSSGTDKIRLMDLYRFTRSSESKEIEREIRTSLR